MGCIQVWGDDWWRLTTSLQAEVRGFSYLMPKRHVPFVTELEGEEARTFGTVLARVTEALKEAASADLVYGDVFGGGIAHLHVHLAPHREGDALSDRMIRGELVEERLPNGLTMLTSAEFPPLPEPELRETADRIRNLLSI
jgi:diadenosine tetraphosphate (Ap4A) HIT family hydrolase